MASLNVLMKAVKLPMAALDVVKKKRILPMASPIKAVNVVKEWKPPPSPRLWMW